MAAVALVCPVAIGTSIADDSSATDVSRDVADVYGSGHHSFNPDPTMKVLKRSDITPDSDYQFHKHRLELELKSKHILDEKIKKERLERFGIISR